jgi:flagellar motor switch protein FliN
MTTDQALQRLGASTSEAAVGALEVFCPDGVRRGPVKVIHDGQNPIAGAVFPAVAASVSYVDGVTGGNIMLMPVEGARRLAATMMRMAEQEPAEQEGELSELELSAIGEAMNQMMSAGAIATSAVLGQEVEIGPPDVRVFQSEREAREALERASFTITAELTVMKAPSMLVQFVPNTFIVRMTRAFDEMTAEYTTAPLGGALGEVRVRVWAELGRARMPMGQVVSLPAGAILELDREVDEPVDLYVDGMIFASGRLVVTDDNDWAVRIDQIHTANAEQHDIELKGVAA